MVLPSKYFDFATTSNRTCLFTKKKKYLSIDETRYKFRGAKYKT